MNDITTALAGLREAAPPTMLPSVLLETGLADGYVSHDGPTGPVFVAFNDRGVSACRFAGDPAEFETEFAAEHGRPAYPVEAVDTTGCGDVFHAGVVYGLLAGWEIEKSLDFAAWTGAMVSLELGGRAGIPSVAEYDQNGFSKKQ